MIFRNGECNGDPVHYANPTLLSQSISANAIFEWE